jgi:predicted phosphodiesterase
VWESVREGIRVYAVHASPPQSLNKGIRLLDEKGGLLAAEKERWTALLDGYSFDVLIVGHTHQVFAERFGSRLVINPGSTKFNHTCMVLTLPDMDVRIFPLSGREPVKSWNWGMMTGRGLRAGKKIT